MNAADSAYLDGFNAALDLAERAGARILAGPLPTLRREHAAAGLLGFVDAARTEMTPSNLRASPSPSNSLSMARAEAAANPAASIQNRAAVAVGMGYVGEACPDCANFTLVRNGTCLKCDTCGSTTGCS